MSVNLDSQVPAALTRPVLETVTTGGAVLKGSVCVTMDSLVQTAQGAHALMTAMTVDSV